MISIPATAAGLARFNALDADAVQRLGADLLACCASPAWVDRVLAARPFDSPAAVLETAAAALRNLSETEVDDALAGHPRIGERLPQPGASQLEQARVAAADPAVLADLAAGNRAYEERFGHVYLAFATGRSAEQLLALLHERLANDPVTERAVLRGELEQINRLRLTRLLAPEAER